jgi:hypothetical protein
MVDALPPEPPAAALDHQPGSARPSALWLVTQLVPSPEVVHGDGVTRFEMRWQVTPLLYSFGVNRRASPWRMLIVEPFVRQSGSIEAFVGPEYIPWGRTFFDSLLWRVGARSYFPLIEYGDYLSMSIGVSYFTFGGHDGAAYEIGLYSLFGIVGAQLTWSPSGGPATTIATLRLRYF